MLDKPEKEAATATDRKPAAVVDDADAKPADAKPKERLKEIVITLVNQVQAHGEMVSELKFRRPTGADIMSLGDYPITINWLSGAVALNPPVMGEMMSRLAAVPPGTIRALDSEDWSTCAYALMGFFPPGEQAMRY